jgi:hypothetical protein
LLIYGLTIDDFKPSNNPHSKNNMTTKEIIAELATYGNEQTKKTLTKHGAKKPFLV